MRLALLAAVLAASLASAQEEHAPLRDLTHLIDERARQIPNDQRAWPLVRDALREYSRAGLLSQWIDYRNRPSLRQLDTEEVLEALGGAVYDTDWDELPNTTDPKIPILWLHGHQLFFDDLAKATEKFGFGWVAGDWLDATEANRVWCFKYEPSNESNEPLGVANVTLPFLRSFREICRAAELDAELASTLGEFRRFNRDLSIILAVSYYAVETNNIVCRLVGMALSGNADRAVLGSLSDQPHMRNEPQLAELQFMLLADRSKSPLRLGEDLGSRALVMDLAQRAYADADEGQMSPEGYLRLVTLLSELYQDSTEGVTIGFARFALASEPPTTESEDLAAFEKLHGAYLSEVQKPFWERSDSNIRAVEEEVSEPDDNRHPHVTKLTLPAYAKLLWIQANAVTQRNATLLALTLHRHHLRHNAWPETLDAIDTELLAELPEQHRLDPFTGKPLLYKLTDEGPIVYSAGADRDDDYARQLLNADGKPKIPRWMPADQIESILESDPGSIDGDWILYPPQN